jgi:hypothetical protein
MSQQYAGIKIKNSNRGLDGAKRCREDRVIA